MSLIGLVRHLTEEVEAYWLRVVQLDERTVGPLAQRPILLTSLLVACASRGVSTWLGRGSSTGRLVVPLEGCLLRDVCALPS